VMAVLIVIGEGVIVALFVVVWACVTLEIEKQNIAVLKSSFLKWFHVISRYLTWFNTLYNLVWNHVKSREITQFNAK
jgi:hypothetical protein